MSYLRKIAVVIAGIFLPIALFGFGFLMSMGQVFGSSDRLKQALEESDVYEAVVASLVQQSAHEEGQGSQTAGIPSSQSAVQDAVTEALPPQALEKQTTQILDGVYAWLQGDTSQLDFHLDLTEIQNTLATDLSEQAKTQAAQLPPCGPDTPVSIEDFDPFGATCLPPGTDPNVVGEKTRQEVVNSELFKDPVLNASDIKTDDGKPLQEHLKPLSEVYSTVRELTFLCGVLSIILAAAIVFLSQPWRSGLKKLGVTLVTIGVMSTGLALLGGAILKAAVDAVARASGDDAIQTAAAKAVQLLADDIRTWWLWYGLALLGIGIGTLIGMKIIKRKQHDPLSKPTISHPVPPKSPPTR